MPSGSTLGDAKPTNRTLVFCRSSGKCGGGHNSLGARGAASLGGGAGDVTDRWICVGAAGAADLGDGNVICDAAVHIFGGTVSRSKDLTVFLAVFRWLGALRFAADGADMSLISFEAILIMATPLSSGGGIFEI